MQARSSYGDGLGEVFRGDPRGVAALFLRRMAFIQNAILKSFSNWSKHRRDLFFASVLCFECFIVSILHLVAWKHDAEWFEELERRDSFEASAAQPATPRTPLEVELSMPVC